MPETLKRSAGNTVAFGDVVQLSKARSKDPEADGFERYLGLEHLKPNDLKIRSWGDVADDTTFTNVFKPGQVLFGKRRAYQKKVAVADFSGVCSGDIYVLDTKGEDLLPELLPFICQSESFYEYVISMSQGGLSPRVNWKALAKYEFALPQREKQRRIAEVLALHDRGVDLLVRASNALNVVKQAMLNTKFPHDHSNQQCLVLGNLIESGSLDFQTGPFGTVLAAKEYTDAGWPIINPTDIRNGRILHSDGPCVNEATASKLEKYRMQVGDVLLARKGEIDKACIAGNSHEGWIVGSDCIRLRSQESVLQAQYLLYFLQSSSTGRMLASYAHGTVMPGLNEKMLSRLELHIPDLEAQIEFVTVLSEIDSRLEQLSDRAVESRRFRQAMLSNLFLHD